MKSRNFRKLITSLFVLTLATLAGGCGQSNVPLINPVGMSQNGINTSACINLNGGPAYLRFIVNQGAYGVLPGATTYPQIPTVAAGMIRQGGMLGFPAGTNFGVVTGITQTPGASMMAAGMMATPTDAIHAVDGSLSLMPSSAGGMVNSFNAQGQIMVTPWRLQDFYRYIMGTSFTGYPSAYGTGFYGNAPYPSPMMNPYYAGGAMSGYPNQSGVLCVNQIAFALKVNTTGAAGYPVNSLYLGNAWVSGIINGAIHGFMMQW